MSGILNTLNTITAGEARSIMEAAVQREMERLADPKRGLERAFAFIRQQAGNGCWRCTIQLDLGPEAVESLQRLGFRVNVFGDCVAIAWGRSEEGGSHG